MYLSPLDYCSEENADLAELLKSFGALSGEAVVEQRAAAAQEEETELTDAAAELGEQGKDDSKYYIS